MTKENHMLIAQIMIDYKQGETNGGHPLDIAIGLINNVYELAHYEETTKSKADIKDGLDAISALRKEINELHLQLKSRP